MERALIGAGVRLADPVPRHQAALAVHGTGVEVDQVLVVENPAVALRPIWLEMVLLVAALRVARGQAVQEVPSESPT